MVKFSDNLDKIFAALADPTRRAILERLSQGEVTVTDLAAPFEMSLPAVSKHIRVLESAGLIQRRQQGRVHHLTLSAAPIHDAMKWLALYRHFWEDSLDSLAALIETDPDPES